MKYIEIAITLGPTFNRTIRFAKEASGRTYNPTTRVWTLPATAGLFSPGVNRTQYQYTILREYNIDLKED